MEDLMKDSNVKVNVALKVLDLTNEEKVVDDDKMSDKDKFMMNTLKELSGVVKNLQLLSKAGVLCKIKSEKKITVIRNGKEVPIAKGEGGIFSFQTEKMGKYIVAIQ